LLQFTLELFKIVMSHIIDRYGAHLSILVIS